MQPTNLVEANPRSARLRVTQEAPALPVGKTHARPPLVLDSSCGFFPRREARPSTAQGREKMSTYTQPKARG